jgi:hypothetical protein
MICAGIIFKVFIRSSKTLQRIVPQQCSCSLDTILSSDYQKKIIETIQALHQENKNPQDVIQEASQEFPEISHMQAEICSADTICFHAQVAKPVFLFNDQLVISDTQVSSKKENVDLDILTCLPKLYSKNSQEYGLMLAFIQEIPKELTKNYTITWFDKNQIVFKSQEHEDMSCLVSASLIPTVQLFQNCHDLHNQNFKKGSKKKNNKTMVEYDIRFKNQIIIKSGGKYG